MNSSHGQQRPQFVFLQIDPLMENDLLIEEQIEEKIEDFQTQILGTRVRSARNIVINFSNIREKICSQSSMESQE